MSRFPALLFFSVISKLRGFTTNMPHAWGTQGQSLSLLEYMCRVHCFFDLRSFSALFLHLLSPNPHLLLKNLNIPEGPYVSLLPSHSH